MKIQPNFIQKCLFTMALLVPSLLYAQVTKECFKTRIQTPVKEVMNVHLTSSDTIPLKHLGTIYALSIDATIEQPREASFVRIVLEDTEGHNYLVAESDWFRNDTTTVQLSEYCEETAQLNGVTPLRLKCYLTNASLQLTGIHTSSGMPKRGNVTTAELRAVKEAQVQDIVDRINSYNRKHHKLWHADITTASMLPLQSRISTNEGVGETDAYLANLIYYTNGFYEIGEPSSAPRSVPSSYIDSFDWRNRHGQDWTTIPKHQGGSKWCTEFATVGTIEAYVNLYYNRHLNLDLSEPYLAYKSNHLFTEGNGLYTIFTKAKQYGIIDEQSYPFVNDSTQTWPISEPSCIEHINIENYGTQYQMYGEELLKGALIKYGPCATGFGIPIPLSLERNGHAFCCVGYGKVTPEKMYFFVTHEGWKDTLLLANDPRIGMDYWICKDSYYNDPDSVIRNRYMGHEGYLYVIFHSDNHIDDFYYPTGSVQSLHYTDADILCEDRDGDGYFNWGITDSIPPTLPSWGMRLKDGDDSDDLKGPMDQYGYCTVLSLKSEIHHITSPLTMDEETYIRNSIRLSGNGKLIVTALIHFYRGATITLESGTVLEVDGGCLKNIIIDAEPGSSIIIKNGGSILVNKQHGEFDIPLGVNLDVSEGVIKINE